MLSTQQTEGPGTLQKWWRELRDSGRAFYRAVDTTYRECCCYPFSMMGLRPVFPSDPFFEATVLDNVLVDLSQLPNSGDPEADLAWIEATIVQASPRIEADLGWLCCTSDTGCCGRYPATDEARRGFMVIRSAKIVDKTGKCHLTVWPKFQDAAEATMRHLHDCGGRPINATVMERSCSGRTYALLEAVPVDEELLKRRPAQRVPMAKVLCNGDEEEEAKSPPPGDTGGLCGCCDEETKSADENRHLAGC